MEPEILTEGLYWWKRIGHDGRPFDTLVQIKETKEGFNSRTVLMLVSEGPGALPREVTRLAHKDDLRPFQPGDLRIWDRVRKSDGSHYKTEVAIHGLEEATGCVIGTCPHCPHDMRDGTVNKIAWHRVNPRFLENRDYRAVAPAPRPVPAPRPAATPTPAAKPEDRTAEVMREVVIALARGEKPQPEDIDFLAGTLGKGVAYTPPTHVGKATAKAVAGK